MIVKVLNGVAPGQEVREEERDKTARMDGGGLEASQHADTTQEGGPEKHQPVHQLQQQPKPGLQLKLQPKPQHEPKTKPKSAHRPSRQWEPVPLRAQSHRASIGPGHAPTVGLSMTEGGLILRRDEGVPLPNKIYHVISLATNQALFQQQAPAHIRITNTTRNTRCTIMAITCPNATAAMVLIYRDLIITAVPTVEKGVINVEENESWDRLKVHAVPLVRYMGNGTEGLQKTQNEIHPENQGVMVPVLVL
jgi:hypothetical protein